MKSGVEPIEASGFIEEALALIYEGKGTAGLKGRRVKSCSSGGCSGTGGGCG